MSMSATASLRDNFNTVTPPVSQAEAGGMASPPQQPLQRPSDGRIDAISSRQDDEVTIKLR